MVREASGIDLPIKMHALLPKSREEKIEGPISVKGTSDAQTINKIKTKEDDHVIIKRRDSAFQDTELRVWLQTVRINVLVFPRVGTLICAGTSLSDAYNLRYGRYLNFSRGLHLA